ncbi:DMP19 family protein [Wukongibacter baidiensis]|uniref:DMP19 family protein n=1 Tax=Wukongibacter baidiensis TaxID=1723361 RepID=UPI003D7F9918
MKSVIYILIVLGLQMLLFSGCKNVGLEENEMTKKELVEITIDDEVINSNDVFRIIEPLWWNVSIYDGEEQYFRDLQPFTDSQRYVFAIIWYLSEVNNGGHDQFYFNSTGIVWEDAMKGFEVIGLKKNYEIIKESTMRLGGYPSKDRIERNNQLEKLEPEFDDLDDRLYKLEKDIDEELLEYIKNNREEFYFKGDVEKPSDFD